MNYLELAREDETVAETMDILDKYSIEWAVAGGWCRDMVQMHTPKDLDIIVYNINYISKGTMIDLQEDLKMLEAEDKSNEHKASEGQELHKVIAVGRDVPVDIIFWKPEYKTIESVLERFDVNMNQFYLTKEGEIIFTGKDRGVVSRVRNGRDMSQERLDRMVVAANRLGWDFSNDFRKLVDEGVTDEADDDTFALSV